MIVVILTSFGFTAMICLFRFIFFVFNLFGSWCVEMACQPEWVRKKIAGRVCGNIEKKFFQQQQQQQLQKSCFETSSQHPNHKELKNLIFDDDTEQTELYSSIDKRFCSFFFCFCFCFVISILLCSHIFTSFHGKHVLKSPAI